MELKRCPRKSCKGPAKLAETVIQDEHGREHLRMRVVCTKCSMSGPWGNAVGLAGQMMAIESWNGEWGRDE